MNQITQLQQAFTKFLQTQYAIDEVTALQTHFTLNTDPNRQQFGDLNSSAPLVLSKILKKAPRIIAQEIMSSFAHPALEKHDIAGAGFINIWLTPLTYQKLAEELAFQKEDFFKLEKQEPVRKYNVEFVSANPTGPLHLGHGRGGIIGDIFTKIVRFIGHHATAEFYINDAGAQIQKLGISFKARCQQAAGIPAQVPDDGYRGEYLAEMAELALAEYGQQLFDKSDDWFCDYAKDHLLQKIKHTLERYGIHFDVWFSEKTLHESGAIDLAVQKLTERGYTSEHDNALWFKSTEFGDDKDRVIKKSDGIWTYVAADIAYLLDKSNRGFDHLVMVLGHDHHSYAVRLQAIAQALGLKHIKLEVILYQLVSMKESGQLLKLSKRAGNIITLEGVMEEVGIDVARFFYLHRKADAQLEFDIDLALKKTEENPVYYVQYAYVRINSILAKATLHEQLQNISMEDFAHLTSSENALLKKLVSLKELLWAIAHHHQTHQLTYFAIELADLFHHYYAINKVIDLEEIPQSRARLATMMLVKDTFATILTLLGISQPEKM